MDRALLLWQIRWLVFHYAMNRLWWSVHDPEWAEYERRLEAGR